MDTSNGNFVDYDIPHGENLLVDNCRDIFMIVVKWYDECIH